MRKSGQRPDGFVAISDNHVSTQWGLRNGFCTIPRQEITGDLSPLAGLDAVVMTLKPFAEVIEFAKSLEDTCRYVTISDALHQRRSEFL
jgi:hypothetical protein